MKRKSKKANRFPVFTERFRTLQDKMTNTEFAAFLGISRQTVGFYCNGDRIPDALGLKEIAEKCKVSADWLLGLTNDSSAQVRAVDMLGISSNALEHFLEVAQNYPGLLSDFLSSDRFFALMTQIYHVKTGVQDIKQAHEVVRNKGLEAHFVDENVLQSLEKFLGEFLGYTVSFVEPRHKIYGALDDVKFSAENLAKEITGYNDLSDAELLDHICDFETADIEEFVKYIR